MFSSSVLGGRGSLARRQSANGNKGGYGSSSSGPRERMSRFVLFSILLVAYSGITLALILWNNSGSTAPSGPPPGGGGGGGSGSRGRGSSVQVLRGGSPARPWKGDDAAARGDGGRGATSTQGTGMPRSAGSDGALVGDGSGATGDALSMVSTEGVGEGAGKRRGGLGFGQQSGQVRRRSFPYLHPVLVVSFGRDSGGDTKIVLPTTSGGRRAPQCFATNSTAVTQPSASPIPRHARSITYHTFAGWNRKLDLVSRFPG